MRIIKLSVEMHEGTGHRSFEASVSIPVISTNPPEKQMEVVKAKVEDWLKLMEMALRVVTP